MCQDYPPLIEQVEEVINDNSSRKEPLQMKGGEILSKLFVIVYVPARHSHESWYRAQVNIIAQTALKISADLLYVNSSKCIGRWIHTLQDPQR